MEQRHSTVSTTLPESTLAGEELVPPGRVPPSVLSPSYMPAPPAAGSDEEPSWLSEDVARSVRAFSVAMPAERVARSIGAGRAPAVPKASPPAVVVTQAESPVEGVVMISPEAIASWGQPATPTARENDDWRQPEALLEKLDAVSWDCRSGEWARDVAHLVRKMGPGMAESPDEADKLVDELSELAEQGDAVAARLGHDPLAVKLRAVRSALATRLTVWRHVILLGGPYRPATVMPDREPRRLAECLAQIEAILADSAEGQTWKEYLATDLLSSLAAPGTYDGHLERATARRVLRRMGSDDLTDRQRDLLTREPFVELESLLRQWAVEPVDLGTLLSDMEQYEVTGSVSDARRLSDDCQGLVFSPIPEHQRLGEELLAMYRDANVRITVTGDLLNRMMPERQPEYQQVRDRVLGRPVRGRSVTNTELAIRMVPDPERLRMALEVRGLVSALTSSTSGPATFHNGSKSTYAARKAVEIDATGLHVAPAEVGVNNNVWLRSLETDFDVIPLIGSWAQDVARSEYAKQRPQMTREVRQKIYTRAKRQIDEEADERLGELDRLLQEQVLGPLAGMGLRPKFVSAKTNDERMTMRVRLATAEQLGGHTPRPWAPVGTLTSFQIHESAINNLIAQMELDGGTFTMGELRGRIATRLNRPDMLETENENDDVKISFAGQDAVAVHFRDGRVVLSLAVARLSRGPRRWSNFQVQAIYRPVINGRSGQLVLDGVVHLIGRLNIGSQLAVRGALSTVFSENRPWPLVPEGLVEDPRLEGLGVTYLVVEDGWIGVALGPQRPEAQGPTVARRAGERPK